MYAVCVSRRRTGSRTEKTQRHEPSLPGSAAPAVTVREARRVERLAYTRTQAAAALGVSRSTFIRRVLPHVDTIEMPWGTKLIPVDELERLLAERRRRARAQEEVAASGRPPAVPPEVVERIRIERTAGKTFGQIARGLTAAEVPTAHGGAQWWASTVRSVLIRSHQR